MASTRLNRAVFLDRDGVLVEDTGHPGIAEEIRVINGVPEGLAQLREAGYLLIVISNQAGIGKGLVAPTSLKEIEVEFSKCTEIELDAWYYCPHHPDAIIEEFRQECDCRKPEPGLLRRAMTEHAVDPTASFMIGNMWHDVLAANRAGIRGILIQTTPEKASSDPYRSISVPWKVAEDFGDAVTTILSST